MAFQQSASVKKIIMVDILALDIAMRTGFAYRENGVVKFGVRDFREWNVDYGLLGVKFEDWLARIFTAIEPAHLAMEKPFFSKATANAGELLHGMAWEAGKMAYSRGVPYTKHAPPTIKKFITGHGFAKKPEVIAAIRNLGHDVQDDNAADAVALLLMVEAQ